MRASLAMMGYCLISLLSAVIFGVFMGEFGFYILPITFGIGLVIGVMKLLELKYGSPQKNRAQDKLDKLRQRIAARSSVSTRIVTKGGLPQTATRIHSAPPSSERMSAAITSMFAVILGYFLSIALLANALGGLMVVIAIILGLLVITAICLV